MCVDCVGKELFLATPSDNVRKDRLSRLFNVNMILCCKAGRCGHRPLRGDGVGIDVLHAIPSDIVTKDIWAVIASSVIMIYALRSGAMWASPPTEGMGYAACRMHQKNCNRQ